MTPDTRARTRRHDDGTVDLTDAADHGTPPPGYVVAVYRDEQRGHIRLDDDQGMAATGVDVGPWLNLWTYKGIHLDPTSARLLAEALTWWADRQHGTEATDPNDGLIEVIEAEDLALFTCTHPKGPTAE